MTHDLLVSVVKALGGKFEDVVISELHEHTYFAKLRVRKNGKLVEIDARPSDAIAIAVTCDTRVLSDWLVVRITVDPRQKPRRKRHHADCARPSTALWRNVGSYPGVEKVGAGHLATYRHWSITDGAK